MQPVRGIAIYALLSLPILLWALITLPYYLQTNYDPSLPILEAIIWASPIITKDITLFGEITPIVMAGAIIALLPKRGKDINWLAAILAVLTYALYIHSRWFFSSGPGTGLLNAIGNITEPQNIILGLISNVRTASIITAASLIGFKLKDSETPQN